jgi:uncharacterized protein (UPF0305 family)
MNQGVAGLNKTKEVLEKVGIDWVGDPNKVNSEVIRHYRQGNITAALAPVDVLANTNGVEEIIKATLRKLYPSIPESLRNKYVTALSKSTVTEAINRITTKDELFHQINSIKSLKNHRQSLVHQISRVCESKSRDQESFGSAEFMDSVTSIVENISDYVDTIDKRVKPIIECIKRVYVPDYQADSSSGGRSSIRGKATVFYTPNKNKSTAVTDTEDLSTKLQELDPWTASKLQE